MKTNVEMNKKVTDTFDSVESIKEVEVSPFFKEKVMHQIRKANEERQDTAWSWFTPKLQLATLVCLVVLNIIAFNSLKESNYDESLNDFATSYGLVTDTQSSILD
ncbi:hypothetical protein [Winogradskyella vidalii]|uniref:hypothetical protein n=1 Tax=Winogradskyella vidalii TaxID=2615024 RepID=UPI0015CB3FC9|nr:hypothetical protein [Winogradskyella vidalii]